MMMTMQRGCSCSTICFRVDFPKDMFGNSPFGVVVSVLLVVMGLCVCEHLQKEQR